MKVLFHRTSVVVRALEAFGVLLSLFCIAKIVMAFSFAGFLYLVLFAGYASLRACDLVDWYPQRKRCEGEPSKIGIQVHFQKALVPTSYILTITSLLFLLHIPVVSHFVLVLAVLMMFVIVPVNGILIFFHRMDHDTLPMNHFSLNQHLHHGGRRESETPQIRASAH